MKIGSIGTSDDELGRMLEVLRFWFTKDLVSGVDTNRGTSTNTRSRNI